MLTVTDFHSHILPGIDDGSASVEESIAMLRAESDQGIEHVISTPHFYASYDALEQFLSRRDHAEDILQAEMAKHSGLPRISVGAEVSFFRGMSESEFLTRLTFRGKRCILIEMPPPPWPDGVYRELAEIREKQELIPVIAHIDRYVGPFRTFGIPQRLAQMPVLVQANAGFFLKKSTSAMAMKMLKAGQIQLLGSDCHNMSDRKPNLGEALARIAGRLGQEAVEKIREYERMILDV